MSIESRQGSPLRLRLRWGVLLCFILLSALAAPAWAAPPGQEGGVHVVSAGDTLSSIAYRYGTTAAAIAQANGISNHNWIYAGQRLSIPGASVGQTSTGTGGGTHLVSYGERLYSIALRYSTTAAIIASANGIANPNFVYVGQRLTIPGATGAPSPVSDTAGAGVHVVQHGESLGGIAARYGMSASSLASLNGLSNPNFIYAGQRLRVSGSTGGAPATQPATAATYGRWIDVNLSAQSVSAFEGNSPVFYAVVSTGLPGTPTPTGQFAILSKYPAVNMSGPGYYLPNVPWTMFFYRGYALHGTYWHSNFGHPMSHGCVNLTNADAAWLYNFASIGTPVVVHY
jgi:LysM repeat protein